MKDYMVEYDVTLKDGCTETIIARDIQEVAMIVEECFGEDGESVDLKFVRKIERLVMSPTLFGEIN